MAIRHSGYDATAKLFHWGIVALLLAQYLLGWLMPDIRRDMSPGLAMSLHISLGFSILLVMILRLLWRIRHPVAPDPSLPALQRIGSEATHWLLYLLVVVTCLTGWTYANMRGWSVNLYGVAPLPQIFSAGSDLGRNIGRLHETMTWVLLAVIGAHVFAALLHLVVYRDGVMARMLPRR